MSHLTSRFLADPGHDDNDYDDDIADAVADADADAVDEDLYPSPWPQTSLGSTHAPPKIIKITTFKFSKTP